jgi:hypothetical protein
MSSTAAFLFAVTALSLSIAGFTFLSLAMDRHWEGVYGRGTAPAANLRRVLRWLGGLALLASLFICLTLRNTAQAWVLWFGLLTLSAWIAMALLSYAAHHAVRAAALALLLAFAAGGAALLLGQG